MTAQPTPGPGRPPLPHWSQAPDVRLVNRRAWLAKLAAMTPAPTGDALTDEAADFHARLRLGREAFPGASDADLVGWSIVVEGKLQAMRGAEMYGAYQAIPVAMVALGLRPGPSWDEWATKFWTWLRAWSVDAGRKWGAAMSAASGPIEEPIFGFLVELLPGVLYSPSTPDPWAALVSCNADILSRQELPEDGRRYVFSHTFEALQAGLGRSGKLREIAASASRKVRRRYGVHVPEDAAFADFLSSVWSKGHARPVASLTSSDALRDAWGLKRQRGKQPFRLVTGDAVDTATDARPGPESVVYDTLLRREIQEARDAAEDPSVRAYIDRQLEGLSRESAAARHGITADKLRADEARVAAYLRRRLGEEI